MRSRSSRLPAAFVVTFSSIAGGCHDATPTEVPQQEPVYNPPPQEGVTYPDAASDSGSADAAATAAGGATPPPTYNPPPQETLNPVEKRTGLSIMKTDTGCEVDPGAGAGYRPGDLRRPKRRAVKCPAEMTDPVWDRCRDGQIVGEPGPQNCECVVHGNPPRITPITCPSASTAPSP